MAEERDIPFIAAMHIEPSREGIKRAVNRTPIYEFYRDKVEYFVQAEKEGVIVAKDEGEIAGFIIVTKSMSRLNKLSITKGYLVKWMVKATLGRYGLNREMVEKLIKIPLAFFGLFKVKSQGEKSREEISHADAKILAIIVLEEERGQGIGAGLLRQACEYLSTQGIREVGVTVLPENYAAKRVYEKLGFVERGAYQESIGKSLYMTKKLAVS